MTGTSGVDLAGLGASLAERGETLAVCESAAGGLISAALLAVPGASAWFVGGAVAYSRAARHALLDLDGAGVRGLEPMSEAMAAAFAAHARIHLGSDWAIAELGIAGPSGSPYGGPAGEAVVAVDGPHPLARRVSTGHADRAANMRAFADAALALLAEAVTASDAPTRGS